jgi:hypothetical protein
MFSYQTQEAGNEFPPITSEQMTEYGRAAEKTGEAVWGVKGLCPFQHVLKLPDQAAIDLAHTLVLYTHTTTTPQTHTTQQQNT